MSWELVGKKCGACGGSLPLSTGVGSRCPHCGVLFGGEKSEYSSGGGSGGGGGDDAAGCCGCLVILGICALIGTCVSQCSDEPTAPVPAPPAVSVGPPGFEGDSVPEEPAPSEEWEEGQEIETSSEDSGIPFEETDTEPSEMYSEREPWQREPESGFALEEEPEPLAVPESSTFRIWTDSTGQHQTEAQFVDYADGKVRLRTRDGNLIEVPAERLSEPDQQWLNTQRRP